MRGRSSPTLLRLLSFALPYWRTVALAWVCVAAASGFVLLMPQLIQLAIDRGLDINDEGLALGSKRTLVIIGLAIIGTAVGRGAFAYGQAFFSEWISSRVAYDLRNSIYNHLQRLSFAYHDKAQTGQLMSRATQDVEAVRMFVSMGLLRLLYLIILLVIALILMATTNWKLALVAWVFMPIIAARSTQVSLSLRPIWMKIQNLQGRMGTVLQESLSGIRVVKAFAREEEESAKFSREAKDLFDNAFTANRIQAFNQPILTGIWMLSMVAVGWYGAILIESGDLTAGELAKFMVFLTLLQMPVRALGWIVMMFARADSAGERIYEILDAESAVVEKPGAIDLGEVKGHVRFENVSFSYDVISPVLLNVDLEAKPGEVIALLGPTGSGKSTVVNLMPRFYDVTGGRITIDGVDIRDATLASLRSAIGTVQQDVFLFSSTVRDNIAYGVPEATQEEIERVARAARVHDFIDGLPHGYDTWVGERGITLSGGQRQRIVIARTLLTNPRILILDDSTSSVDTETEHLIQQALAELMKGRTTFVIAQRLRTVTEADQILVLQHGRVIERGRHEELIEQDGLYREIYDLELRDQEEAFERTRLQAAQAAPSPAGGAGA
ncbi:MAG: ABC transporter ATP-binding protein [Chloroflexi bacterium]|nr:ABC transporter ATP-binding protein [Chloroflexota bacterium]